MFLQIFCFSFSSDIASLIFGLWRVHSSQLTNGNYFLLVMQLNGVTDPANITLHQSPEVHFIICLYCQKDSG